MYIGGHTSGPKQGHTIRDKYTRKIEVTTTKLFKRRETRIVVFLLIFKWPPPNYNNNAADATVRTPFPGVYPPPQSWVVRLVYPFFVVVCRQPPPGFRPCKNRATISRETHVTTTRHCPPVVATCTPTHTGARAFIFTVSKYAETRPPGPLPNQPHPPL